LEILIAIAVPLVLLAGIVIYIRLSQSYRIDKIRREYIASLQDNWDDSEVRGLIADLESNEQAIIYVHETLQ
jgi:hypothetical protein